MSLYICAHIHRIHVTKTISLADDAYEALAAVKRPGESFSDVARRLARDAALDEVFGPTFGVDMSDREAKAWKASVVTARERDGKPRVPWP